MPKLRQICTGRKINPDLCFVHSLVVILSNPFSYFHRRGSDDRIEVCVVVRLPPKNLNPERPLLERF
jgi:hypothetical protein